VTLTGLESLPQVMSALQQASAEGKPISRAMAIALEQAVPAGRLHDMARSEFAALLYAAAMSAMEASPSWRAAAAAAAGKHIAAAASGGDDAAPRAVAQLLWGVSELVGGPSSAAAAAAAAATAQGAQPAATSSTEPYVDELWVATAAKAVLAGILDAAFFAPDLCTALCALGSLGYTAAPDWAAAVAKEAEYQVTEFMADFTPQDLARLASGLADLRLQPALGPNFQPALMKAVYSKLRTIEDKGAVDFALAKLETGERSMHYDPRWTHEELRWLPRRERDKRRIIEQGFVRSQWGGWAPGGRR